MFHPLIQRLVAHGIGPGNGRAVCEIGEQTWTDATGARKSSADFYRSLGYGRYVALDIAKQWLDTLPLDLDQRPGESPWPSDDKQSAILTKSFDLVTNNGTGEHIFNQAAVFEWAHELCRPGGLMLHVLPCTGWLNHGFYSYSPLVFRDIAAANDYTIEGLYLGERNGRMERLDGVAGLDPWHAVQPHKEPRAGALERTIASFGDRAPVFIIALLRMPNAGVVPGFKLPIQGKYAGAFANPEMAKNRGYDVAGNVPLVLPENAQIVRKPFPHVIIPNALPADLYDQLAREWPDTTLIAPAGAAPNTLHQMPAHRGIGHPQLSRTWQAFLVAHTGQAWVDRLMRVFAQDLAPALAKLPQECKIGLRGTDPSDLYLDVQLCVNTPQAEASSVRGPHLDSADELLAGLLYMPVPGDKAGGELVLYAAEGEIRMEGKAEVVSPVRDVAQVPYEPNTLVFFVNGAAAIHGVTPRGPCAVPRRYVNFLLNAAGPVVDMPERPERA